MQMARGPAATTPSNEKNIDVHNILDINGPSCSPTGKIRKGTSALVSPVEEAVCQFDILLLFI